MGKATDQIKYFAVPKNKNSSFVKQHRTIAGASNYNVGKQLNIGIESQDNQHSFTNGTSVENIWTYPVGVSGFQNYTGTAPIARETNTYGWYSG